MRAPALLALGVLAACDPVVLVNNGVVSPVRRGRCGRLRRGQGARELAKGRVDAAGWSANGAGASRRRCFSNRRRRDAGLADRHCNQRNDFFVRIEDSAGVRCFAAPPMTTYKLYGRDGPAICEIVEEAQ